MWDGNIQDHPDQGVVILVMADVAGKETPLLRFNCFDFERSYIYGPENPDLRVDGPAMLGRSSLTGAYLARTSRNAQKLLGKVSDYEIARRLRISRQKVRNHRKTLGIPAPKPVKRPTSAKRPQPSVPLAEILDG